MNPIKIIEKHPVATLIVALMLASTDPTPAKGLDLGLSHEKVFVQNTQNGSLGFKNTKPTISCKDFQGKTVNNLFNKQRTLYVPAMDVNGDSEPLKIFGQTSEFNPCGFERTPLYRALNKSRTGPRFNDVRYENLRNMGLLN